MKIGSDERSDYVSSSDTFTEDLIDVDACVKKTGILWTLHFIVLLLCNRIFTAPFGTFKKHVIGTA